MVVTVYQEDMQALTQLGLANTSDYIYIYFFFPALYYFARF